jgi:hypothetical protein
MAYRGLSPQKNWGKVTFDWETRRQTEIPFVINLQHWSHLACPRLRTELPAFDQIHLTCKRMGQIFTVAAIETFYINVMNDH